MFGIPTAVISIVCYSLCCMDTVDEEIHSDDEDSDDEYREIIKGLGVIILGYLLLLYELSCLVYGFVSLTGRSTVLKDLH